MTEEEEPQEDTAYNRALEMFKYEQQWYAHERELLEEMEDKHQARWKRFMQKMGRL